MAETGEIKQHLTPYAQHVAAEIVWLARYKGESFTFLRHAFAHGVAAAGKATKHS